MSKLWSVWDEAQSNATKLEGAMSFFSLSGGLATCWGDGDLAPGYGQGFCYKAKYERNWQGGHELARAVLLAAEILPCPEQVIAAGVSRTSTQSLSLALAKLGHKTLHAEGLESKTAQVVPVAAAS